MSQPVEGISLDAAAVRDEMDDGPFYTDEERERIASFDDDSLNDTLHQVVTERFWEAYDEVRSDAIRRLLESTP